MSGLDIRTSETKGATLIKLSGSADMREAMVLNRHLEGIFSQEKYHLVIDLSGLHFTASMGLGILIQTHTKCRDHQGRLAMVNPQPAVMKVFRTMRLDQLFNIYHTVEEAMQLIAE